MSLVFPHPALLQLDYFLTNPDLSVKEEMTKLREKKAKEAAASVRKSNKSAASAAVAAVAAPAKAAEAAARYRFLLLYLAF